MWYTPPFTLVSPSKHLPLTFPNLPSPQLTATALNEPLLSILRVQRGSPEELEKAETLSELTWLSRNVCMQRPL